MCPQSEQTETLQPSLPDLQAIMEAAALLCTGEGQKEAAYSFHALSKTCWILSLCMARTSHPVKGADSAAGAVACQMDIDDGRMDGLMSQEGLDGEKVRAVLVKVGAESVAEGMAGDTLRPAQPAFVCMDMSGKEKGVDGLVPAGLFRKKVSHRTPAFEPVPCKDVEGSL